MAVAAQRVHRTPRTACPRRVAGSWRAASRGPVGGVRPGPGRRPGPRAGGPPATVQFYFSGDQPTAQLYQTLKEVYERQNPRYTLDLIHADTEIEKLLTLIAAGTPADVFWNRVRTSQILIRREGSLADVLPLMKRDKLTQDDFWPSAVKAYTYKGGYYGLPTSASSNALYYNKEHFRQAGLPFPEELEKQGRWNWDTLLETSRKLSGPEPGGGKKRFGFLRPTGLVLTVQYMWQNGGTPFSDDRSQCLLTSNECVGALQFLTDLVLKHQVSPGPTEPDAPNYRTNFRVSMEQAGRYLLPEALPGMQSGAIDPGMVVAPKGPKKDTTRGDDLAASILKSTKVLEAAWAFAKLLERRRGAADRAQVQPQLHRQALHRPQPGHPQAGAAALGERGDLLHRPQPHGRLPHHPQVHPPGGRTSSPARSARPTPGRRRCAPPWTAPARRSGPC